MSGARGTAYWNVRLLDRLFEFDEIRVHSRRPESRDAFAERLSARSRQAGAGDRRTGAPASRAPISSSRPRVFPQPEPMLKTEWIKPGALRRALRHDERGRAVAHRHHGQDRRRRLGTVQGRSVRRAARARRRRQAVRGDAARRDGRDRRRPQGRRARRDDETILFWHRGLSLSDIALGAAMLEKAARLGHRAIGCATRDAGSVANARMYAVNAGGAATFGSALFAWVAERSGVPLVYVDHAAPAPLEALWSRPDLGLAFMCGYPFARAQPAVQAVAAPLPARPRCGGRAVYWTDFTVRPMDRSGSSPTPSAAASAGRSSTRNRASTPSGTTSCAIAPVRKAWLFRQAVGPLVTPRRVTESLLAGEIDVGPLDSYYHELLRRFEPQTAARLRTVEFDRADADAAPRRFRGGRRPIGRPASPNARRLRDGCRHGRRARGASAHRL